MYTDHTRVMHFKIVHWKNEGVLHVFCENRFFLWSFFSFFSLNQNSIHQNIRLKEIFFGGNLNWCWLQCAINILTSFILYFSSTECNVHYVPIGLSFIECKHFSTINWYLLFKGMNINHTLEFWNYLVKLGTV